MMRKVLKALPVDTAVLIKGLLVPENARVIAVISSESLGKRDVLLEYEYDFTEEPKA